MSFARSVGERGRTGPAWFLAWLVVLFATSEALAEIMLYPEDDIQTAVDAAPVGAVFVLTPGVYRRQAVIPKDNQEFIGKDGAILNGAMLLPDWRKQGDFWIKENLPTPQRLHGDCQDGTSLCRYREDLFVDGDLFRRVPSPGELEPGRWFYEEGIAYLVDRPDGKTIEMSITPLAFGGRADGVVLRNLVVEKYASAAQKGAIDATGGIAWKVLDVTARWNHGLGLKIGDDILVRGGFYAHNGQMGMGGEGDRALIEQVEIAYNNYAGFLKIWEAGGAKFVRSDGLVVRDSCIHHNDGAGLWFDIDNINTLIDGNYVFDNARSGIKYEISFKATIRNNKVTHNGWSKDRWLWGSQILVQNSQDVEVYENTVEIAPEAGNGIGLIYQDRGKDGDTPYLTSNNVVRDNHVILTNTNGKNGIVADFEIEQFWRDSTNRFDGNVYYSRYRFSKNWAFENRILSWAQARSRGFESNGTLILSRRPSIKLSCKHRR